jgi:CRP/FNR family transcriptional regulator, cyclic AMP receptor protein
VTLAVPAPTRRASSSLHHAPGDWVHLLEADSALAENLEPGAREPATAHLRARVRSFRRGGLDAGDPPADTARHFGFLVLEGLLVREVRLSDRSVAEILGPGDVLRPWEQGAGEVQGMEVRWRALTPVRMAELDAQLMLAARRWPEVAAELAARGIRRANDLAAQAAISHLRRVEDRLVHLLTSLAGRWGRVTPDGVVLSLPLTHATLAQLVGARRPSVTAAFGELAREGLCIPRGQGTWLLPACGALQPDEPAHMSA